MLAFKRRNEGFEWHRYVRTTIKLKRQDRREKIAKARQSAVSGLQQAGKAGVSAGGSLIAALLDGMLSVIALVWHWFTQLPALVARLLGPVLAVVGGLAAAAWDRLDAVARVPVVRLGALGALALGATWAAARFVSVGLAPIDVRTAIGVAGVAGFVLVVPVLSSAVPAASSLIARPFRRIGFASARAGQAIGLAMVAAVAVAVGWFAWSPVVTGVRSGVGAVAGFAGLSGPEIKGRATVAGATTLVVAGTTIRLAGLDAPVADQPCPTGSDRNRRCAAVAQAALSDIVRGQQVACEVVSGGGDSIRTAVCKAGGIDVGGQLVSRGAAFAEQGLFSRYGTEDTAARAAKAGIWRGAAERPSDYKAKLVEAARKQAPNGCAIKGTITGDSKRFVQPWDADYARVRLRTSRGEKWFCSEDEALAAGFKPSART